jgi:hypothetical protein
MKKFSETIFAVAVSLLYTTFYTSPTYCFAQAKTDTLVVQSKNLDLKNIRTGNHTYVVYSKKTKQGPSERAVLVKINTEFKTHNNKPALAITQQWDLDTVVHSAYTVLNVKDFSTLFHTTYWKRLGYAANFDFETKKVSFTGSVPDSVKLKSMKDFDESFNKYNLNWHSDLVIFPLLPFKENRTFKINFYDPGFGGAEQVSYSVSGSDFLMNSSGEKIECWVLEHKVILTGDVAGAQRFWISKKTKEVLKEEDELGKRGFRYKLKLGVSEND